MTYKPATRQKEKESRPAAPTIFRRPLSQVGVSIIALLILLRDISQTGHKVFASDSARASHSYHVELNHAVFVQATLERLPNLLSNRAIPLTTRHERYLRVTMSPDRVLDSRRVRTTDVTASYNLVHDISCIGTCHVTCRWHLLIGRKLSMGAIEKAEKTGDKGTYL